MAVEWLLHVFDYTKFFMAIACGARGSCGFLVKVYSSLSHRPVEVHVFASVFVSLF